jgi:hypothetical protein
MPEFKLIKPKTPALHDGTYNLTKYNNKVIYNSEPFFSRALDMGDQEAT